MKTIILAGGKGLRLAEETTQRPKPLVQVGGIPLIMHIMSIYAAQGYTEFIIAKGYLGNMFNEYFSQLSGRIYLATDDDSDYEFVINKQVLKVHIIETGAESSTAMRIKRCVELFPDKEFFLTYGDGLANVDIDLLLKFHKNSKGILTLTRVPPTPRFGRVVAEKSGRISYFGEKRDTSGEWINGGFMVLDRIIEKEILESDTSFEFSTIPRLVSDKKVYSFEHNGYWRAIDSLRDRELAELDLNNKLIPPWLDLEESN